MSGTLVSDLHRPSSLIPDGQVCRPAWVQHYVRLLIERYPGAGAGTVLPVAEPEATLPPPLIMIALPAWAADLAADGGLLVPQWAIVPGLGEEWQRVDWFGAAAWYLHGSAERLWERRHGPIHSYSARLVGWDSRLWRRAWVNRIGLFLRRRAAHGIGRNEIDLFGPLPQATVVLTHDVDAITKTLAIRLKQGAFNLFNLGRALIAGNWRATPQRLSTALGFLIGPGNYWHFETIETWERALGVRSLFFVHGGRGGWRRSPVAQLFDPGYAPSEPRLAFCLRRLAADGFEIGLHPSFLAWRDPTLLNAEKARLEAVMARPVAAVRQHWLRFSWSETWRAQVQAGLTRDYTLGFNDRPGFRTGAAFAFTPWDDETGTPLPLTAVPNVLMDSHLYDYAPMTRPEQAEAIHHWLGETRTVGGETAVIWHQQTMGDDYGWSDGYRMVLEFLCRP